MGRALPVAVGSLADEVWGETAAAGVRSRSLSQGTGRGRRWPGRCRRQRRAAAVGARTPVWSAICTATL